MASENGQDRCAREKILSVAAFLYRTPTDLSGPELKDFPDKVRLVFPLRDPLTNRQYIYALHLAPISVQKSSNCIIGTDYPSPMLDEQIEKSRCIARIKNAFSLGLHGDSPEVLDGSAEGLLRARHLETGALKVEGEELDRDEREEKGREEKGKRKREVEGNTSLDAFVTKSKSTKK